MVSITSVAENVGLEEEWKKEEKKEKKERKKERKKEGRIRKDSDCQVLNTQVIKRHKLRRHT